ncbi:MAG: acetyl-CoA carboxylase biotin carboxyl carrier protein [Sandaracinaceae bacterium]|nr:acetyl-CoA carboxylase biotin carboxyl carrier protein [Sandaracinaceae bacterium]
MDIDLEQLRELMRAMTEFQMSDMELEKAGERISLRRGGAVVSVSSVATSAGHISAPSPAPASAASVAAAAAAAVDEANTQWITSPFVGTFYASPSPGAAAFVKVGQTISPGTVLCIVEAMKLMNEIESEVAGVIVEITGTNGKPVEYGDRLFKIKVA